jgi:hypothetical protein
LSIEEGREGRAHTEGVPEKGAEENIYLLTRRRKDEEDQQIE